MLALNRADILSPRKGLYPFVLLKEEIATHWPFLEPMIARSVAKSKGTVTTEVIYKALCQGEIVCFGTAIDGEPEAIIVVQATRYETYTAGRILACAGKNLKDAMQFWHIVEGWAHDMEAVEMEAWCRPAVERLLRRYGWRHKFSIVSLDLRRKLQ
jgi:hypothetical protein